MVKIQNWLQQPTSVAGLSALIGTVSALFLHQITWPQAAPLLAGALASIALPDNSDAKNAAATLASGLVAENAFKGEKK